MATTRTVRPESMGNGQEKCPGFCYTGGKNTTTWITYTRKRGRPEGSKSVKSKIEQKPELFENNSDNKYDNFEPHTPTRKRGRTTRSKSTKRKVSQKSPLVDSRSNTSERKKDNDEDFEPELQRKRGGTRRSKSTRRKVEQKPLLVDSSSNCSECKKENYSVIKGTAQDRAVELKKKLPTEGLSFVKRMMPSHVDRVFWLGLPAVFCRKHLPTDDVNIVLEDEEGQTYHTNYIADKTALSGGWVGFARQHHLKVGDALVFHLVRPARFKVYILRENKLTRIGSEDSDKLASKEATSGGIRSPGPDTTDDFAAMKSFDDNFKVVVGDGMVEALPDCVRETYYSLCRARKAFLHGQQTSPTHALEMIVETAKIADGIRACDSDSLEDLKTWKKTLESLESLGMDVAFLRRRVDDLLGILSAPSVEPESFAYKQLKLIRADAVKQQRNIKSTMSSLKHTLKDIDAEMEEMVQASLDKKEEQATAPW